MLVRESISFERGADPKNVLGIGEYYLIKKWLDEMRIENYHINDDMTINVIGDVHLQATWVESLKKNINKWEDMGNFPEYIQFNHVSGDFYCQGCGLKTLRGCPKHVMGDFYCSSNNLTSFQDCPKHVMGDFWCYDNEGYNLKINDEKYLKKYCKIKGQIGLSIY